MTERTRLGLDVLCAGLMLGALGDALLRESPWGLNIPLWVAALALAVAALVRRKGAASAYDGRWLLPCALAFAAGFAWRDSPTLRALDAALVLILLALNFLRVRGGSVLLGGLSDYVLAGLVSAASAVGGWIVLLARDIGWKELPLGGWSRQVGAVLRGVVIAVPLLFLFGVLFAAADAAYEGLVRRVFLFDAELFASHAAVFTVVAVLSAGFLGGMFMGRTPPHAGRPPAQVVLGLNKTWVETPATGDGTTTTTSSSSSSGFRLVLGAVETGVVLGLLNVLFFSFVAVQLRYFFGGAEVVLDASGPTYAEYARRGFFELAAVAGLVLPLLLAADWVARQETKAQARAFRGLAAGLVGLLFVIMASALGRMRLYQSEYGQTELRLYTTAFMFWLAAVFVWFGLTVLRGRRERFACGALVAALVTAAALHVFNPNDHIVRANAALARTGRGFDGPYAASLGADAVPALLDALPELRARDRAYVSQRLVFWAATTEDGWRSWNRSRSEARRAIREREPALREWARQSGLDEEPVASAAVAAP